MNKLQFAAFLLQIRVLYGLHFILQITYIIRIFAA
jgi:hypothetical protein